MITSSKEKGKKIKIFGYLTIGKRRKEIKANRKKEGRIKHILLGKETKMKKKVNKIKKKQIKF